MNSQTYVVTCTCKKKRVPGPTHCRSSVGAGAPIAFGPDIQRYFTSSFFNYKHGTNGEAISLGPFATRNKQKLEFVFCSMIISEKIIAPSMTQKIIKNYAVNFISIAGECAKLVQWHSPIPQIR